jgi:hypothetical protein
MSPTSSLSPSRFVFIWRTAGYRSIPICKLLRPAILTQVDLKQMLSCLPSHVAMQPSLFQFIRIKLLCCKGHQEIFQNYAIRHSFKNSKSCAPCLNSFRERMAKRDDDLPRNYEGKSGAQGANLRGNGKSLTRVLICSYL